uniref:Aminotransferase class I/classII domain-containing protein n=1 Tax=Cucumis sativus TaxID=3659 RepID=A0A0A0KG23_CUCSA
MTKPLHTQTLDLLAVTHRRSKPPLLAVMFLFMNSGKIAPLDEIIKMKEQYRFGVLLDESNSFGVHGCT